MSVTLFRSYPGIPRHKTGWSNQEIAEFYRIADIMRQAGLAVEAESGTSDEGDPWFVFARAETGDVIAHFARVDGLFLAASSLTSDIYRGGDVRQVIDQMLRRHPLMIPQGVTGGRLLLHPSVVLTAFVAAAFIVASDEAQAKTLDDVLQTAFTPNPLGDDQAEARPDAGPVLLGARGDTVGPAGKPNDASRIAVPDAMSASAASEKQKAYQFALLSAVIMACEFASREVAVTVNDQSATELGPDGLATLVLSARLTPMLQEATAPSNLQPMITDHEAKSVPDDLLQQDALVNTFFAGASMDVVGVDDPSSAVESSNTEWVDLLRVSLREDLRGATHKLGPLSVEVDVVLGSASFDQLVSNPAVKAGPAGQEAIRPTLSLVSEDSSTPTVVFVNLIDLVGSTRAAGGQFLNAFLVDMGAPRDYGDLNVVLVEHADALAAGEEVSLNVEPTSATTRDRIADDMTSDEVASNAAKAPEGPIAAKQSEKTSAASAPVKSAAPVNAPESSQEPPQAAVEPQIVRAVGHVLDKGDYKNLVLTDAVDVLLYHGGNVTVHNFELGKDRLWFYLPESEISSTKYHFVNDTDLVLEFSSGDSLTLFDVFKGDLGYGLI
jgi:hypothetical protein